MVESDLFTVIGVSVLASVITGVITYSLGRRTSGGKDRDDTVITQTEKDFENFRKNDRAFKKDIIERFEHFRKQVEMLQTVAFGVEAHSTPNYMFGLDPEADIGDKPGEGAFYEQSHEERARQTNDNEERIRVEKGGNEYERKKSKPTRKIKKKTKKV
jgi:hypothetical protein